MTEEIYRPGLEGVIASETAISRIQGGLQYRGYAIADLADNASFEEVAYLVLRGELPTADELAAFRERLGHNYHLPPELVKFLRSLPRGTNMMDVLQTVASALAHWDPEVDDSSRDAELRKAERLIAQLPAAMAARYRLDQGKEPFAPSPKDSHSENILRMLLREGVSEQAVAAMNTTLVIYAEHELNASAFASRVVASTLSDLHSSVSAAIGALKGPLHGGANARALELLLQVGSPERAATWVREALAAKKKVMGFGHRVYRQGDPRAIYLKPYAARLAEETGNQQMEETAETIERIMREEKGIPPNVDWPTARVYHYLGLPVELYTPLFAVSRVVGWSAHAIEQHAHNRIMRPLGKYNGPENRAWVPIEDR